MIANVENIMEHAVAFPNGQSEDMPTQSIAERYHIVVIFAGRLGQKFDPVKLMERVNGARPSREILLSDVLNGTYQSWGCEDAYHLGVEPNSCIEVEVVLRFREFAGTYMEHCHNTQHEHHAMLMRWDNTKPGATVLIPTPRQTWEGTFYEPSFSLPTAN